VALDSKSSEDYKMGRFQKAMGGDLGFPLILGIFLCMFRLLLTERFHWGEAESGAPLNTPLTLRKIGLLMIFDAL